MLPNVTLSVGGVVQCSTPSGTIHVERCIWKRYIQIIWDWDRYWYTSCTRHKHS